MRIIARWRARLALATTVVALGAPAAADAEPDRTAHPSVGQLHPEESDPLSGAMAAATYGAPRRLPRTDFEAVLLGHKSAAACRPRLAAIVQDGSRDPRFMPIEPTGDTTSQRS